MKITKIIIIAFLLCFSIRAQTSPAENLFDGNNTTKYDFDFAPSVIVTNAEELYAAVNNPANAGNQIVLTAGVYALSATDAGGAARPNGGRLELQENMALRGVAGNREAVVIDAAALPASSYAGTAPVTNTGVIRAGKGSNLIEWLTVRNALSGGGGIIVHLTGAGSAYVRIAHVASYNNPRGIDVRNVAAASGTYALEMDIADNDLFYNQSIATAQGLRIVNNSGGSGTSIFASLSGNRSYGNRFGLLAENLQSSGASITIYSSGDRFYENGAGVLVGGALGVAGNGNTLNFTAAGTTIENNNGVNTFDRGGLVALGGENTTNPNGMLNNSVNVILRNCRLANNQESDLKVFGARSTPASIGNPGTGNFAKVRLYGTLIPTSQINQTIPDSAGAANIAQIVRNSATPSFDFDGDGRADLSIFRPTERVWYLNRSQNGFAAAQFGLSTDRLVPADYDGDGKNDIAVFRDGIWYWINSSNGTVGIFQWGMTGDLPQPADYDGDGRSEIAVLRDRWYVYNLANRQISILSDKFCFNADACRAVVNDYDGDGRADYATYGIYASNTSEWFIKTASGNYLSYSFGINGDKPVPADYDGDGKTDIAVFRPSNGVWYIRNSSNGNTQFINWGLSTDIPVPADYDGDGKADIAIFRDGVWWIRQSASGISVQQFGLANDKPTSSVFLP